VDEVEFDGSDGAEVIEIAVQQPVEVGWVFGGGGRMYGGESVFKSVLEGAGAAGIGDSGRGIWRR
jgi:hypothetical protein